MKIINCKQVDHNIAAIFKNKIIINDTDIYDQTDFCFSNISTNNNK